MKPYDVKLEDRLRDLPHLRRALGAPWITAQDAIDPDMSEFQLARTLRVDGLRPLVESLDRSLGALAAIPGNEEWHEALRTNPQGYREVLTEVTFAVLLQNLGYAFKHQKSGPDFAVDVNAGDRFLLEVITPRIVAWEHDLTGRLWILSRQFDHSVRTQPCCEGSPILDVKITQRLMLKIVEDSKEHLVRSLSVAPSARNVIVRDWPQVGLRIIWTPSHQPRLSGINEPTYASSAHCFDYIWYAVNNKVGQLRKAGAHTLVIGANQLPFPDWDEYVQALRLGDAHYGPFDWSLIHEQVRYLILFMASYEDNKPPTVDVAMRPGYPTSDQPEVLVFLSALHMAGEARRQSDPELIG